MRDIWGWVKLKNIEAVYCHLIIYIYTFKNMGRYPDLLPTAHPSRQIDK